MVGFLHLHAASGAWLGRFACCGVLWQSDIMVDRFLMTTGRNVVIEIFIGNQA
jgi:hypothetical protein